MQTVDNDVRFGYKLILSVNYIFHSKCYDRRLVSLDGKVPVYLAGCSGSIPGRTNTQGLKMIEEKVLPLL